jgi:pyruvate/2-oxoglutarate dehydrogenase complex dihydrolipoamide dehydrogenase (E3) component
MSSKYDLVVIGSGPAGEKGAAQAAYFGKKVALVEKADALGGAAANTGTLPSKTLRETALYLSGFRQRGLHGVTLSMADQVSARDFLFHQQNVTGAERARIQANLERHRVDQYKGFASFTDPQTVAVTADGAPATALTADVFLIATGSRPHRPGNFPFQDPRVYDSDTILGAAGRSGNTAGMNLEAIGVTPGSRGQLEVNAHYQTSLSHVYAAGDVIGFPALASTSMEQARVAMVHAFDLKYKTSVAPILPYGIYTIPECSVAGETEESLEKQNIPYVAGRARYEHNPRGQIIGDRDGFLKLLFREEDMRLLGVSVIGEQATELVHIGLTAILQEATAELFIQTCFNYPTLSELYKYATYDALGARAKRLG